MSVPRLVGVIHLPPLPGSPRASVTASECAAAAAADARLLAAAGFELAIVENFGDIPFYAGRVPAITVAAMTLCAAAVREACPALPIGLNVLRNDAESALDVAAVVGAACIRINVHVGARVTDQGIVEGRAAETLRRRRALGASGVQIWADVDVKHSAPLAARPLGQEAEDTARRGMADALLVTGDGTGKAADLSKVARVAEAAPGTPVFVASGGTVESLPAIAGVAHGVIVGSALREGGVAGAPIDAARAHAFAEAFRRAFGGS